MAACQQEGGAGEGEPARRCVAQHAWAPSPEQGWCDPRPAFEIAVLWSPRACSRMPGCDPCTGTNVQVEHPHPYPPLRGPPTAGEHLGGGGVPLWRGAWLHSGCTHHRGAVCRVLWAVLLCRQGNLPPGARPFPGIPPTSLDHNPAIGALCHSKSTS